MSKPTVRTKETTMKPTGIPTPHKFTACSSKAQDMKSPGLEVYIEAGRTHLIAIPLEDFPGKPLSQLPRSSAYIIPGNQDVSLGSNVRKIHDYEMTILAFAPAPSDKILVAGISGPAGPLTEFPLPFSERSAFDDGQQLAIKSLKSRYD